MYDLIIIGGGPAGIAAGIYSARKRLKTLFLARELGGQSTVSSTIENWIGTISISGADLGKQLVNHLNHYKGEYLNIEDHFAVSQVEKTNAGFRVSSERGQVFECKTVLVATGSKRRKLDVPGAAEYEGKGIVYCASCDAPVFEGLDVVVVGGGNAGFETASQLIAYAKSITILEAASAFRAEQITVNNLLQNPKVKGITGATIKAVLGEKFVSGLSYLDIDGNQQTLPVQGVFVEIGNVPESDIARNLVDTTPAGAIKIDPRSGRTSQEGIWAAGDCADLLYHQNNIAAGSGIIAVEDIYNYLLKKT